MSTDKNISSIMHLTLLFDFAKRNFGNIPSTYRPLVLKSYQNEHQWNVEID